MVPVQVSFIFKFLVTVLVLTCKGWFRLVCNFVLFQTTLEWETLATFLTHKTQIIVHIFLLVRSDAGSKMFSPKLMLHYTVISVWVVIQLLNRTKWFFTDFTSYGASNLGCTRMTNNISCLSVVCFLR